MAFFEWNDKLSVGISAVDRDHKGLIECVNQLNEAFLAGRTREVLDPLLSRLIAAANDHFLQEEIIWEAARYIDLDRHKEQHADLLKTAREFQAKYRSGGAALSIDVMRALSGWVNNHILTSDKEAADAIGAGARAELNAPSTSGGSQHSRAPRWRAPNR